MTQGPGKYDDACTAVRVATQARGTVLIVIGGHSGSGFSAQGEAHLLIQLPAMLRHMADQIERDNNSGAASDG
jgi:hypothetical protein